jgi:hypothetical protein
VLAGVAFAPAMLVASTANRTSDPTGWGAVGNLLVGAAFMVALAAGGLAGKISASDAQADTAEGRAVAEHWLAVSNHYRSTGDFADKPAASVAIWDRHLAYATAMGLARRVQREIPFETEHDRRAWSRATGEWRRVKIRYQAFRPNWGVHPGRVLFEGLIQGVLSGVVAVVGYRVARDESILDGLTDAQRRWISLGGLVVGLLAAAVFVFCLAKVVLGLLDLFRRRTVEGELVRRRLFKTGHRLPKVVQWLAWSGRNQQGTSREYNRNAKHHLAIDDGSDESVVAYVVKPAIYGQVSQGARVRLQVSPLLGYVSSIEVLTPAPRSAASESAVPHALVEDTLESVGTAATGSIGAALARAETMTDESGRPLLDQTDDEGVTMRRRIEQSHGQLDRLRNDPRLASSPLAGLLDSVLGGITDAGDADADDESPPY